MSVCVDGQEKLQSSCIFNTFSVEDYNELTMTFFMRYQSLIMCICVRCEGGAIRTTCSHLKPSTIYYALIGNSTLTAGYDW